MVSNTEADSVALIKDRVNLFDVVSKKVKLVQRSGNQYVGLCPFHSEKTPSFNVNGDNGLFYCFGCGVYGDVIQFVSDTEGMEFKQAIEHLSRLYHIELPKGKEVETIEPLYRVMELAASWFTEQLHKSRAALAYLKVRGISDSTVKRFRLGYAPNSGLKGHLLASKVGIGEIRNSGLMSKNEQPCLYSRIVFPIFSVSGRVISFGGRAVSDKQSPKYINTSENVFFKKRESLYGFHIASCYARKLSRMIVVEGYMDVLIMHQLGISNTVGLLGTSCTESHLNIIWGVAKEIIVWMDGDNAGLSSSMKIAKLALSMFQSGRSMKFVVGPVGKDPCDICVDHGISYVHELIDKAKLLSDFIWENELSRLNIRDGIRPEQCIMLEGRVKEYVSQIRDVHIAKYYRSFFYRRIRALQNIMDRSVGYTKGRIAVGGFMTDKLKNVSLRECIEKNNQLKAMRIIMECPMLLEDGAILEQFAGFAFTGDMRTLQQHIVNIKDSFEEKLTRLELVRELKLTHSNLYEVVQSLQAGMVQLEGVGDSRDERTIEDVARKEWEKLMLSEQLRVMQEQIMKLKLEGQDEVAARLSEHAQIVDGKLRDLWSY